MLLVRTCYGAKLLLVALLIAGLAFDSHAQQSKLGNVEFATTGSKAAQDHFLRGVAALHSFWYEEALEEFRASTKADADFMMGYWGEAMAHNHPLWSEQDTEAARKALEKIKDTGKLTDKERAFLGAVKLLYGEGDKRQRDLAYSAAMEKIYRDYPNDLEAASFYALSLLGAVRPESKGYRNQVRAGAIALDVYKKNPNHPGAAHYIIHSFDDPEHAILALPAAYRYADIAPEAHHARHMPSHIFLQLGMWPEAAASNESAWSVSDAWVKGKNLPLNLRDYHSLHWLLYVYLQQGRYSKAEELLALMRKTMAESSDDDKLRPNRYGNTYADMAAAYIIETQRWELSDKLFETAASYASKDRASAYESAGEHAAHGAAQAPADPNANVRRMSNRSQTLPAFIQGLAAAMKDPAAAEKSIAGLRAINAQASGRGQKASEIQELEIAAVAEASEAKFEGAIEKMKKAVALEEDMPPPSGPPSLIKPSHELFGEILLRAGKAKEAAEQFRTSLLRQPSRARSLIGLARAAAKSGDRPAAIAAYSDFLRIWQQADSQLPELQEAREYLGQASAR